MFQVGEVQASQAGKFIGLSHSLLPRLLHMVSSSLWSSDLVCVCVPNRSDTVIFYTYSAMSSSCKSNKICLSAPRIALRGASRLQQWVASAQGYSQRVTSCRVAAATLSSFLLAHHKVSSVSSHSGAKIPRS